MTQNWTIDCFAAGHVAQTDLQSMENNFITIKSQFSGALQPVDAVEGLLWHDTTASLLKQYHSDDWVTVYDLGNDRATSSLDCERSVIAGTGLSGGGALTADRTLAHAAHTGEVTGATALTIANDIIGPSKASHGSLMVASDGATETSATTDSYVSKYFFSVKCPAGPTVLRAYARLKNSIATVKVGYGQLTVTGVGSSAGGSKTGNTYTWLDLGTVNMSGATPATVYAVTLDFKADSSNIAYVQGISVWWE